MIQLSADTSHINNGFGDQNVGGKWVLIGMQYSGSYGDNLFGARSTHDPMVNIDTTVAFSVAYNALNYSKEYKNDRTTNGSTCE